jgi:hypothetical protein
MYHNIAMAIYTNKTVSVRRDQFLKSWNEFAPEVTFADMSLAEFEEKSKPPMTIRSLMEEAKTKLKGLILDRDKADEALNRDLVRIANAVRAHKDYGPDCAFYRSLGFIPESERKTGRKTASPKAPESADAA